MDIKSEIEQLKAKIEEQNKKIEYLELLIEHKAALELLIEKKVVEATFHQTKSIQHRIDQFLFDAKIALKKKNSDFFNSIEYLAKKDFNNE
jgi:predicted nuclease with TOPRIM domain